jgi:plasmid stabilization system protein ParE
MFDAQSHPRQALVGVAVAAAVAGICQHLRLEPGGEMGPAHAWGTRAGTPGRVDGARELVIPHTAHIAAYRVTNRTLEIIAFLHEAQQWPDHR